MSALSETERTRIRRLPERAGKDRESLYAVLDAGRICHLGVIIDGSPRVIPTGYGRHGDTLYLHGSTGATSLRASEEICVTVTHLDALVLARSVFHHSLNYRSAMIYGRPRYVTDPAEKLIGLEAVVSQLTPGRWSVARLPTRKELAATAVLALSLEEASVKTRSGPPGDDEEDYTLDVWAGEIPVVQSFGAPVPDPRLRSGIPYDGQ